MAGGQATHSITRFCKRGHDVYAEGIYFQFTTTPGKRGAKRYRTLRCARCRIEDVQNCRAAKVRKKAA